MSQTEKKPSSPSATSVSSSNASTTPDVINKAATKLCHIVKRPDFDGYGFNLHSEKAKPGQFIGKVDANSPAEAAGLKEGDRIIEVNGVPINNETHKQVVQRIKAISCEVRLLLLDVDGKGDGTMHNGQQQQQQHTNGKSIEVSKTEQVLPGASENINSITMVSTKRASQESQRSSSHNNNTGLDVTDKAISVQEHQHHQQQLMMNNNNNNVPPPPSATMMSSPASPTKTSYPNNHNNNNNINSTSPSNTSNGSSHSNDMNTAPTSSSTTTSTSGNGTIKAGSLQLPMTAAEMRAKLMMKKKYDPKNESVDLKKKYEIVQKL